MYVTCECWQNPFSSINSTSFTVGHLLVEWLPDIFYLLVTMFLACGDIDHVIQSNVSERRSLGSVYLQG